jgi:hypothetical protein
MLRPGTDTRDYRLAPSGVGPLAAEWADKPHRLVYDLCGEVERLRDVIAARAALAEPGSVGLEDLKAEIGIEPRRED